MCGKNLERCYKYMVSRACERSGAARFPAHLVRSGMEYASVIWDPPTKADSNKLEKIQRTTARWILSSYSYKTSVTSLLQQLQLESLAERRKIQRLAFMYKILNDQVAVPATSVDLTLSSRPSRGVDANQQKLVTVRCHTEIYRQSYCIRTVKDWNTAAIHRVSWLFSTV